MWKRIAFIATIGLAASFPATAADVTLRVLFVGNSYLYTNDLPSVAAAFAGQRGVEIKVGLRAEPDFALSDHLNHARFRQALRHDWDWIVLQQGPTSLRESRRELIQSVEAIAALLKGRPGRIALMSAWPQKRYRGSSTAAEESYRLAAQAIGACVLPVATAWRYAGEDEDAPGLYQRDGLHPNQAGTVLAALTLLPGLIGAERSALEAMVTQANSSKPAEVRALELAAWRAHRDEPRRCQ
jgi:hypothetical protein